MDQETDTSSDLSFTALSDVECDACTGRKRKAEQSCLQCLASYCESHLDMHNSLHVNAKRHKLVVATGGLRERVCTEHGKLLEVFCRTDRQCICHLCITDKHKGHDVVLIDDEVAEERVKLGATQKEAKDRIKTRENEMQKLKQAIEAFKTSAAQAVEENEKSFTELIHFVQRIQCAAKETILAQEEAAVKKAEELLERLPSEISGLKRRDSELERLERLSRAENGVHFLQGLLSTPALSSSLPSLVLFVQPYSSFKLATEAVSDLVKQMKGVCNSHFANISKHVHTVDILTSPVLKMRETLLQNASKLTLNPDTAHVSLCLSKENREVTAKHLTQDYPEHPDRFERRAQILCNEALQGTPRYWEVEYGGNCWVCFAVSYIGIYRKIKCQSLFGRNHYSWGLRCYSSKYEFWHNNKSISVPHSKRCSRIGVYLNHGLGILEFYNVSNDMSLIYKAQTKFTEPLYAGFGLAGKGTHVKLCDLQQEDAISVQKKTLISYSSNWHEGTGSDGVTVIYNFFTRFDL